ncbi:CASP-like protein 1E1 [Vicia villosa]|uniref:CASP-like protein 1E1 n=1 Tax=Vicia villosa TaxID=3911 RepID=UPI00273BC9A1|nr:CASP-like protein 1E1 [Vicia villosa]
MENQSKAIFAGTEEKKSPKSGSCELILRLLAFVLTLAAAIVIGTDKQTKVVPIKIADSLPPFNVPVSAKWHYLSAFVYFMVANAIACAYGAISMLLTFLNRGNSKVLLGTLITMLDTLMVALLFSGNGAAAAVGLLGYNGNSHVRWSKVCDVFDKFCHQVAASIILSLLGSLAFLLLIVILPILRFQRRT